MRFSTVSIWAVLLLPHSFVALLCLYGRHFAWEPRWLLVLTIPQIVMLFFAPLSKKRRGAWVAVVSFPALVFLLRTQGFLLQYEDWIQAGMP